MTGYMGWVSAWGVWVMSRKRKVGARGKWWVRVQVNEWVGEKAWVVVPYLAYRSGSTLGEHGRGPR